jgi:thiamine biosynthesis lipoprotein
MSLINWRDVVVDPERRTVFLRRPSMRLDLGGFMKGYAADEMVRILSGYGVSSAMIDLGGNIFAMGSSPRGAPWRIGIQDPEAERGSPIGVVEVTNKSVTTAGVYEHYFTKNGKRYSHIMNLRTGYPVENGLVSVTVIADKSIDADAYDTALLVMGKTDGIRLAERIGLDIIMVDDHHRLYATPGARRIFTLAGSEYSFAD